MQIDRYEGGIIGGDDKSKFKDKVEDFESKNKVENKNRNNIRKSFGYEGKITNKDNEEKCKDRIENTKNWDKIRNMNRNDVNN